MTIIFLLNLYCDSLLYGMQRQFALTTEPHKGLEDYEPEMNTLVTTSLQAEKLTNSTFITYRKQLYVGCLLLSALCKTHVQKPSRKWLPLWGNDKRECQPASPEPANSSQLLTGCLCSPEWLWTTRRWIGTVWIFYSINLALLLCGGWGMWFITYKNLDSPWLNVKTLASVRKFMNFTHMIINDLY